MRRSVRGPEASGREGVRLAEGICEVRGVAEARFRRDGLEGQVRLRQQDARVGETLPDDFGGERAAEFAARDTVQRGARHAQRGGAPVTLAEAMAEARK